MTCHCKFCITPGLAYWKVPTDELTALAQTLDDRHKLARVSAYIELCYRAGIFSPAMPYFIWQCVVGPDIPPPVNATGMGAFTLANHAAFVQSLH